MKIEEVLKEGVNVTDKYVAFWGSIFSNFYPCNIHNDGGKFPGDYPCDFVSSEQYFMWQKAMFFGDDETAKMILEARTPQGAKSLGRKVRFFDEKKWETVRETAMYNAVFEKFSQNPYLKEILLDPVFDGKNFVEGSPVDRIYGVGIKWDDPEISNENNWAGLNLLGKTIDKVRNDLAR